MLRANMYLPAAAWARVARPVMGWPQWVGEVRFRGRLQRQRRGRIAVGGCKSENGRFCSFTLAVRDDGWWWIAMPSSVGVGIRRWTCCVRWLGCAAGV